MSKKNRTSGAQEAGSRDQRGAQGPEESRCRKRKARSGVVAGREKEERKEWKDFPAFGGAVETLANSLRAIF